MGTLSTEGIYKGKKRYNLRRWRARSGLLRTKETIRSGHPVTANGVLFSPPIKFPSSLPCRRRFIRTFDLEEEEMALATLRTSSSAKGHI